MRTTSTMATRRKVKQAKQVVVPPTRYRPLDPEWQDLITVWASGFRRIRLAEQVRPAHVPALNA